MGSVSGGSPLLTTAPPRRELGGLGSGDAHTRVGVVGIGHGAGAQVAGLLDAAPCRLLVSLGYAGALDPHLYPGDLVVAGAYHHGARPPLSGAPVTTRAAMLLRQAGLSVLEGAVLTVDEPLLTPLAKRRAHNGSGALVADMEGRWIAEAAAARDVPLIGVRAVLDEARFPLPSFIAAIIADEGRREWTHAFRALSQPSAACSFIPLARKAREASRALELAAQRIIPEVARLL
ncbi:MAG: hypothetical protein OXC99_11515 [Chloroflexi bacterium]|nr:hypothetical protein [Chloroflexota bacterium]